MITYRKGKYGPIFAEGMARAIRTLGKEKYGDNDLSGAFFTVLSGQRLDLPVSLETAWGPQLSLAGQGL
jgi:aldehyde:ferredoxin oxidoreductase